MTIQENFKFWRRVNWFKMHEKNKPGRWVGDRLSSNLATFIYMYSYIDIWTKYNDDMIIKHAKSNANAE